MRRRHEKEGATSSEEDYGFFNPALSVVEPLYWEHYSSNGTVKPELAGALDQDEQMRRDLNTYGWIVGMAEEIIKQEEKAKRDNNGRR